MQASFFLFFCLHRSIFLTDHYFLLKNPVHNYFTIDFINKLVVNKLTKTKKVGMGRVEGAGKKWVEEKKRDKRNERGWEKGGWVGEMRRGVDERRKR